MTVHGQNMFGGALLYSRLEQTHVGLWKRYVGPSEVVHLSFWQIAQCLPPVRHISCHQGRHICVSLVSRCCLSLLPTVLQDCLLSPLGSAGAELWHQSCHICGSVLPSVCPIPTNSYGCQRLLWCISVPELHRGKVDWVFLTLRMGVLAWFPSWGGVGGDGFLTCQPSYCGACRPVWAAGSPSPSAQVTSTNSDSF